MTETSEKEKQTTTRKIDFKYVKDSIKPPPGYIVKDISNEQLREVVTAMGVYTIVSPVALISGLGQPNHIVIDEEGKSHMFAAPETGRSVVRWSTKPGAQPVSL